MQYFEYISDAKVDMLLSQIPRATTQEIAAKLGFNIGVLHGELESKRPARDDRVARLLAVIEHLETTETLGSFKEPAPWIRDSIEVNAGWLDDFNDTVFFIGGTDPKTLVGKFTNYFSETLALAGSSAHLLGRRKIDGVRSGYSFLPSIMDTLKQAMQLSDEPWPSESNLAASVTPMSVSERERAWSMVIQDAHLELSRKAPQFRIEFIARTLLRLADEHTRVILATPLYVALEEA